MNYEALHTQACEAREETYRDPETGYQVFTAYALEKRGSCCGCGCRHCPFGDEVVQGVREPWIEGPGSEDEIGCDVLFWSGGKDSYLALRALQREAARPVVLATTFEDQSEIVAHQGITIENLRAEVAALAETVLLVPLGAGSDYLERVEKGIEFLRRRRPVFRLAFGDLHLEGVRTWRELALAPLIKRFDVELTFPVWHRAYADLAEELAQAPVECRICAIADERLEGVIDLGDRFDEGLIRRLPAEVDAFGENGEFHTRVTSTPATPDG